MNEWIDKVVKVWNYDDNCDSWSVELEVNMKSIYEADDWSEVQVMIYYWSEVQVMITEVKYVDVWQLIVLR